jgi:hypothetical protein
MMGGSSLRSFVCVRGVLCAATVAVAAACSAQVPSAEQMRTELSQQYLTTAAQPLLKHHGPLMKRLELLIGQQARYLIGTLHPWERDPNAMLLTTGQSGEHGIRPNTHTAFALAAMARCIPDACTSGLTPQLCRDKALAILRFVVPTHGAGGKTCSNDQPWQNQWQSALWAHSAGKACWLLWDDLDPEMRWLAARMICDEADRFVGQVPPTQVVNDTKAEENAWNSKIISLACCMFPHHPHHEAWRTTAIRWTLSSFATAKDVSSDEVYDGRPLREWLTGPNIHDDYTLENHNRVHPDYMHTFDLCRYQRLTYEWAGLPPPRALDFNGPEIYASLKMLSFPDGGYVYPNGQDWGLRRNLHWTRTHLIQAVLNNDPQAARLARNCIECTELMAARSPDGGLNTPEEYFFPSTQHYTLEGLVSAWLLMAGHGEGPDPVSEEKFLGDMAGLHLFSAGSFGLLRTSHSVASFSWGRQVMGMVMPLEKDLLLAPNERSLVGVVSASRLKREAPRVRKAVVSPMKDALGVCGVLERAGGAVEQRIAFLALPDGRSLYVDQLRQTSATKGLTLELGLLSVVNDLRWVYGDGKRDLHHEGGRETFAAAGETTATPRSLKSRWYNLDDNLGIVCLWTSGRQTYVPNHKPDRGRIEQSFFLNSVGSVDAKPGSILAESVLLFYPGQAHRDTQAIARKVNLEAQKGEGAYAISLEDGRNVTIDLNRLSIQAARP